MEAKVKPQELAIKLNKVLYLEYDGISHTTLNIINHLITSDVSLARAEYYCDGDKIPYYTEAGRKIHRLLYSNLGCRLHAVINCQNTLCWKLNVKDDQD